MKYISAVCASFLAAFVIASIIPGNADLRLYDDVLRLHVIAQSDSEADQELKLKVRDRVLETVSAKVDSCTDIKEACAAVSGAREEIQSAAEECVTENGFDYPVKVELVRESYPRRDYGGAVMPAGEYNSLKVIIGDGEGHNWWCVLFPSICTRFAEDAGEDEYIAAGFTPEEYRIITGESGGWKIKFRLLEILSDLFGGGQSES